MFGIVIENWGVVGCLDGFPIYLDYIGYSPNTFGVFLLHE
jgi:hypothetical protein